MTIADLESEGPGGRARGSQRGAGAVSPHARRRCSAGWPTPSAPASTPTASSPTSSTATSTTRTSASRAATSARSTGRSDRPKATCSASTSSSGRSTRRSRVGGVQLLLQGGHNPDLPLDVVRGSVPRGQGSGIPTFKLHALSPPEVIHLSRLSQLPVPRGHRAADRGRPRQHSRRRRRDPRRSRAQAAALLRQGDRRRVARRHAPRAPRRPAHDGDDDVRDGRDRSRSGSSTCCGCATLQDETGGFTAFITWSYQPEHTELGGSEATGVDYLRTLAHRAHRPRQLRQPAGVVGHAGRQGRAAEPRLRRQRHGQRDDRGERRPRRRRQLLHGRSRDRPQHRGRRASSPKRRNMHYEILGDPIFRERDVPRMLELAAARADGDTSRAPEVDRYAARSAAEKKRAAGDSAAESVAMTHVLSRRLGPARSPSRRSATAGSRSMRGRIVGVGAVRRSRRDRRSADVDETVDLGDVADPARPRQRAHASRAVVAARAGAAGAIDAGVGRARLHRAAAGPAASTRRRRSEAGDRRGARERHRARRRHQQHARDLRAARRRARSSAVVFYELLGFSVADPAAARRRPRGAARRADAVACACGRASRRMRRTRCRRRCFAAIRRRVAPRSRRVERASGESAEEVRVPRDRRRPVARAARGARRRGTPAWKPPGVRPGGVPRAARAPRRRGCSRCTACS